MLEYIPMILIPGSSGVIVFAIGKELYKRYKKRQEDKILDEIWIFRVAESQIKITDRDHPGKIS